MTLLPRASGLFVAATSVFKVPLSPLTAQGNMTASINGVCRKHRRGDAYYLPCKREMLSMGVGWLSVFCLSQRNDSLVKVWHVRHRRSQVLELVCTSLPSKQQPSSYSANLATLSLLRRPPIQHNADRPTRCNKSASTPSKATMHQNQSERNAKNANHNKSDSSSTRKTGQQCGSSMQKSLY